MHGGVIAAGISAEKPFIARRRLNAEAKQRIAKVAVRLLRPGECCFIDAGTTTAAFATALSNAPLAEVVTNSLDVASTSAQCSA